MLPPPTPCPLSAPAPVCLQVGSVADPATGERQEKAVFVVFFAGERARQKALKICEAFSANRYPFPEDLARQRQMNAEVRGAVGASGAVCSCCIFCACPHGGCWPAGYEGWGEG